MCEIKNKLNDKILWKHFLLSKRSLFLILIWKPMSHSIMYKF